MCWLFCSIRCTFANILLKWENLLKSGQCLFLQQQSKSWFLKWLTESIFVVISLVISGYICSQIISLSNMIHTRLLWGTQFWGENSLKRQILFKNFNASSSALPSLQPLSSTVPTLSFFRNFQTSSFRNAGIWIQLQ